MFQLPGQVNCVLPGEVGNGQKPVALGPHLVTTNAMLLVQLSPVIGRRLRSLAGGAGAKQSQNKQQQQA